MKKIFTFIALAAMALSFSACKKGVTNLDPSKLDDTTEKCWKATFKASAAGHSGTDYSYYWCTERALVIHLQKTEQISSAIKCSYEAAPKYKDEMSCDDANYNY